MVAKVQRSQVKRAKKRSGIIFVIGLLATILFLFSFVLQLHPGQGQQYHLAIFNPTPTNFEAMSYVGEILYSITTAFEGEKEIDVMPRREMEEILFHAGLVQGNNHEQALKAGKALGVQYVLFGEVTKHEERVVVKFNLMDINQGAVRKNWSQSYASREAIEKEMVVLAGQLLSAMQSRGVLETSGSSGATDTVLPSIESLTAQKKNKKAEIVWKYDVSQPFTAFHVYRADSPEGPFHLIGKSRKNSYTDSSIVTGPTYFYQVGLVSRSGQEIKSARIARLKDSSKKQLHPPLILEGQGHVRWASIKFVPSLQNKQQGLKVSSYTLYRYPAGKGGEQWQKVASLKMGNDHYSSTVVLTFEDMENLLDGQRYSYCVTSVDREKGESEFSDSIDLQVISKPKLFLTKDGLLRQTVLGWETLDDVKGYYLYRREENGQWKKIHHFRNQKNNSYTDKESLSDGRRYEYALTGYDKKQETSKSNSIVALTKDLPSFPEKVKAETGLVKSVGITWTQLEDVDVGGYAIYRLNNQGVWKRITRVSGVKSNIYTDKGGSKHLRDGTEYSYQVRSYNTFKAEGPASYVVKATTKPRPAKVEGMAIRADSDHIIVSWQANSEPDIKHYILSRQKNESYWSKFAEIQAGTTQFIDRKLQPEAQYRYKLVVLDEDNLESDLVISEYMESPVKPPQKN